MSVVEEHRSVNSILMHCVYSNLSMIKLNAAIESRMLFVERMQRTVLFVRYARVLNVI